MGKIVRLIPICSFIAVIFGCTTFSKMTLKDQHKADTKSEEETPPKSSGYLTKGSTVMVDTGDGRKKTTILEEYRSMQDALVASQNKIDSLQEELKKEREHKAAIESEREELKRQLEAAKQISVENERLTKELSEVHKPYLKKIEDLTMELARAQLEETKAKQELTSFKIEQFMENKDTANSQ